MGLIYDITNHVNGKRYVGQTKRELEQRFKEHLDDAEPGALGLSGAIAKYGTRVFSVSLIETVDDALLSDREQHWIAELKTFGPGSWGYNLTSGGEGGYKRTPELLAYMRQRTIEAMADPIVREKCGRGMRGKKHKVSTLQKMSVSSAGERNTNFGKFGQDHPAFGHRTPQQRANISNGKKGWNPSLETRERMSKGQSKPVACYTPEGDLVKKYPSSKSTANDGFSALQVNRAVRGRTKGNMHGGFLWRYA